MRVSLPRPRTLCLAAVIAIACGPTDGHSTPQTPKTGATLAVDSVTGAPHATDPRVARADSARIEGNRSAPVFLVAVSDFQCPYCKEWHDQTYPALVREYVQPGKIKVAYVNFPLPMHQNAWPAAEAAMCAGAQNRFWPMADALFATQDRWESMNAPQALYDSLALAAGADTASWHACLTSHVMRPLIQADYDRSVGAGVNSTPTFFIGTGRTGGTSTVVGAQPVDSFRVAIDRALAAVAGTPAKAPPR